MASLLDLRSGEAVPATRDALLVIAGKEYGTGSSRDWAAKGTLLLGVRAVIAESFERIHRSNLVGMGVIPLEFKTGDMRPSLGLTGFETFDWKDSMRRCGHGRCSPCGPRRRVIASKTFQVVSRIDTPEELSYYRHGGILRYVLRHLVRVQQ